VPDEIDPYKTLQVDPEADPEVIQAAYRRLARKYHPDVVSGPDAAAKMVAINRAWALLEDPEARAAHDRERAERATRERRRTTGRSVGRRDDTETAPGASSASGAAPRRPAHRDPEPPRSADTVSRDWTSGRSTVGSGYDPRTMGAREGFGAAGPPPGNPSGSVLTFGRYAGWSTGEVGRRDIEYLEWLDRVPIGRPYRDEIDQILRRAGRRNAAPPDSTPRRGFFRRG
jgi:curved DNA-binding protein CbpA